MRVADVGDLHEPFTHPGYCDFVLDQAEKWQTDTWVLIGDVFDNHAISFHDHDPDGRSSGDEVKLARKLIKRWHRNLEGALVCIGNHDCRPQRQALKHGISSLFFKEYNEMWKTPTWRWDWEHRLDGVLHIHGTGTSGKNAAINNAIQRRISITQGHIHGWAGIQWHCNPNSRIFGLNVGCGIDNEAYAFAYGKMHPVRPVLGMGIVIDGEFATFIPMHCGRGEKYHRSRFKSKVGMVRSKRKAA